MKNMETIMAGVSTLIEQLLMILIALGVLVFLLSMYLPLFRVAERFSIKRQLFSRIIQRPFHPVWRVRMMYLKIRDVTETDFQQTQN